MSANGNGATVAISTIKKTTTPSEYCFDLLEDHFNISRARPFHSSKECPVFVSWKEENGGALRGCIGNLIKTPLAKALNELAIKSAFKDGRFKPIKAEEINRLECQVSMLHDYEEGLMWDDWNIGEHGIVCKFPNGKSATYLPEIPIEQKWTKMETIKNLALKGGYSLDNPNEIIALTRFKSEKCMISYREFKKKKKLNK